MGPGTVILLISASHVAEIIGESHQHPALSLDFRVSGFAPSRECPTIIGTVKYEDVVEPSLPPLGSLCPPRPVPAEVSGSQSRQTEMGSR
jgi:hypothetical protein